MDNNKRLFYLFDRYYSGMADSAETKELAALVGRYDTKKLDDLLMHLWDTYPVHKKVFSDDEATVIFQKVLQKKQQKHVSLQKYVNWSKLAAAAAVLLIVTLSAYQLLFRPDTGHATADHQIINPEEVLPGGNMAMLTLADGSVIVLEGSEPRLIARQSGSQVLKLDAGRIVYQPSGAQTKEVLYNTITTPRGGQYQLVLADGTEVFLNSSSMIRFPVEFAGNERKVEVKGEAFFEVKGDDDKPFIVLVNNTVVEVLGTSFNVMAYADENHLQTTLIAGSLMVRCNGEQLMLRPGEQAQTTASGQITVISEVDTEQITAWKNGWFRFRSSELESVMRQISRWYDLDVVYQGNMPVRTYTGVVSRNSDLSKVLHMMEMAGISFRIEDSTIYVTY